MITTWSANPSSVAVPPAQYQVDERVPGGVAAGIATPATTGVAVRRRLAVVSAASSTRPPATRPPRITSAGEPGSTSSDGLLGRLSRLRRTRVDRRRCTRGRRSGEPLPPSNRWRTSTRSTHSQAMAWSGEHAVADDRGAEAKGGVPTVSRPRSPWPSRTASIWSIVSPSTSSSHRSELDADRSTVLSPSSASRPAQVAVLVGEHGGGSGQVERERRRRSRRSVGSSTDEGARPRIGRAAWLRYTVRPAGTSSGSRSSWPARVAVRRRRQPGCGRRRTAPAPAARAPRRSGCPSARAAARAEPSRRRPARSMASRDQPGVAHRRPRPTGSRGSACRRRWWRRRGPRRAAQPSSGRASGSPIHSTRNDFLVVLVVDEAEGPGVVARGHRPAPVERGAEHGHDARRRRPPPPGPDAICRHPNR